MSLIVKPHHPWKSRLVFLLLIAALGIGGWSLFEYGRYRAGYDQNAARIERADLQAAKRRLAAQVEDLKEQKVVLERTSQIDRQSYTDLQSTLKNLQNEILELKEELAFYRGIVSPRDTAPGLRLQSFRIDPSGPKRHYRYTVVLTQVLKNDRVTRGNVRMQIDGMLNGRQKTLSLAEVSEKQIKELDYKFKYFQNIEGEIVLPKGFAPQRVTVQVLPHGTRQDKDKIEATFDWPAEENLTHVGQQKAK